MSETPKRMAPYVRASSAEQTENFDIESQEEEIGRAADELGYDIVAEDVDEACDSTEDLAARQGNWVPSRVPYGYCNVEVLEDGLRRSTLEVDLDAAEAVRGMFERADQGVSLRNIAAALNTDGVVSASEKPWTAGMVRQILINRIYTGVMVVRRNTDERVEIEGTHPAIVSPELFARIQEVIKRTISPLRKHLG